PPTNETSDRGSEDSPVQSNLPSLNFAAVSVSDTTIRLRRFDGEATGPRLPDASFGLSFEAENISFAEANWQHEETLRIYFNGIDVRSPEAPLVSATNLVVGIEDLNDLLERRTISQIEIEEVDVILSPESLARFRSTTATKTQEEAISPPPAWIVDSLSIGDGSVVLTDSAFGENFTPRVESKVDAELRDLRFGGEEGFDSEGLQEIQFASTRLWAPGVPPGIDPLFSFDRAELVAHWSDFDFEGEIDRLAIRSPKIVFTDESLGAWLEPKEESEMIGPINRPVYRIKSLEVTDGKLRADSQFADGAVPILESTVEVETLTELERGASFYRFHFDDLSLRNHEELLEEKDEVAATGAANEDPTLFPEAPLPSRETTHPVPESEVLTVRNVTMEASADQLQRTREVETVTLQGAVLRVGDGLKSMVEASQNPETTSSDAATIEEWKAEPVLPTWVLKRVQVTESQVRFEQLLPQIEGLEFAVETTLTDLPLSPEGLLAQDQTQKIELAGIEIKDPYDSFITVAFLPTIFAEFSLAGLARQEIDRIDLIGPELHVGQGLFWWVDYQRRFRAQNEGATVGIDTEIEEAITDSSEAPDWAIRQINATAGKIVIAPTGVPIGVVPFPFNASTNMQDGEIELKLNIPDEEYVYRFPEYEVDLYGLTGDVQF
ncbi:MAG: hypothetical protein AAGC68_15235, partial [Verrucomicrobiota bacterium]